MANWEMKLKYFQKIFHLIIFYLLQEESFLIENIQSGKIFFKKNHIDYCINCAAYTAVDKAESEKEKAFCN